MNASHIVGSWLNILLGVDSFEGHCSFLYDERIELSVETIQDEASLLLYAKIMRVPPTGREQFYENLLALNHPSQDLQGASLSLNALRQDVVLWYRTPVDSLSSEQFQSMLANFVELAERLWEQLRIDSSTNNIPRQERNELLREDRVGMNILKP